MGRPVASYGWIIDTDHEWKPSMPYRNEAGTRGPGNIGDDTAAELSSRRNGRKFRMYDGDEVLMYSGRIITQDDPGSEVDFAPLDDFGEGSGCTSIYYQDENGSWFEL